MRRTAATRASSRSSKARCGDGAALTGLLRRVSVTVPEARAEPARAVMLELFPEGFEELDVDGALELAAYTNAAGEERIWQAFGGAASATDVDGGWEERWRQFHRPQRVGSLWIGPPWETPDDDAIAVVIDPGRAFGTGGHATTRLCLGLLEAEERGSVLDVGCGSGVLAIAAVKLGFGPVIGIDFDPQAVEASERNALDNRVAIDARLGDLRDADLPVADLALANIAAEAVGALGPRLNARRAITSGYLVSDEPELSGFRHERRVQVDGWAADVHVRL